MVSLPRWSCCSLTYVFRLVFLQIHAAEEPQNWGEELLCWLCIQSLGTARQETFIRQVKPTSWLPCKKTPYCTFNINICAGGIYHTYVSVTYVCKIKMNTIPKRVRVYLHRGNDIVSWDFWSPILLIWDQSWSQSCGQDWSNQASDTQNVIVKTAEIDNKFGVCRHFKWTVTSLIPHSWRHAQLWVCAFTLLPYPKRGHTTSCGWNWGLFTACSNHLAWTSWVCFSLLAIQPVGQHLALALDCNNPPALKGVPTNREHIVDAFGHLEQKQTHGVNK